MLVYVKNNKVEPIKPINPASARILLKQGLVKIIGYFPFTIQYLEEKKNKEIDSTLFIDLRKDIVNFNLINDSDIIYSSQLHQKKNIKKNLETKAMLRHSRRSKKKAKSRYRANKFSKKEIANNIKIPDAWLAPSVKAKLHRIIQEIEKIKSLVNINNIKDSKKKYNIKKLTGELVDYDNLRYYAYKRDKYTCQICGKKKAIEYHHINHKHEDNYIDNVITLCSDCHHKVTFNQPTYNKKLDAKLQGLELSNLPKDNNITTSLILFSQLSKLYDIVEYFGFEFKKLNLVQRASLLIKKVIGVGHRILQSYSVPNKNWNFNTRSFIGNFRKGFRAGDLVIFEDKKYYIKGNRGNSFVLTDSLKENNTVTNRSPSKLKLLHSFGSLSIQELFSTSNSSMSNNKKLLDIVSLEGF